MIGLGSLIGLGGWELGAEEGDMDDVAGRGPCLAGGMADAPSTRHAPDQFVNPSHLAKVPPKSQVVRRTCAHPRLACVRLLMAVVVVAPSASHWLGRAEAPTGSRVS